MQICMKILATLHFMCFQKVLNEPQLKLKQAKDVRWLTHCNAVEALRKSYKSVVFSLSREASERSCATEQLDFIPLSPNISLLLESR